MSSDDDGGFGADFDDAVRRMLEDGGDVGAPREPSFAERQRAARQADLQRRLIEEAEHERFLAERDERSASTPVRRARRSRWLAPLVVIALVGGGIALASRQREDLVQGEPEVRRPADWPPADTSASDVALGTPPALPAETGPFAFLNQHDDGTPVTWDPCRPVRYVINPAGAPPGGEDLIHAAAARASAATGLQVRYEGSTDEVWTEDREPYQPDRYGNKWAPVLITWSNAATVPDLAPEPAEPLVVDGEVVGERTVDPAGIGGPVGVGFDELTYVSGSIALDIDGVSMMLVAPGGTDRVRSVIQHEIGHVLGLGHVDDPAQLMYQASTELTDWGTGDLHGLHALGSGECFPEV